MNPTKHTIGATFMRRTLNMSGSYIASDELGPLHRRQVYSEPELRGDKEVGAEADGEQPEHSQGSYKYRAGS